MRTAGLLLLAVGVGLAAAFGARLSAPAAAEVEVKGRAALLAQAAESARARYCEALPQPGLDPAACPTSKDAKPSADGVAPAGLSAELAKLRQQWVRRQAEAARAGQAAAAVTTPSPEARLSAWFAAGGVFFLLGIAVIVVGAVLVVRAERAAGQGDGGAAGAAGEAGAPARLSEALKTLEREVDTLLEQAKGEAPDWEAIKQALERLRYDHVEPIVEARDRYQRQLGMERFAMAFGPFSSAERMLYRAWSALVDGYHEEVLASLRTAHQRLEEGLRELGEPAAG